jgi:ATP-dependent Zn protease
MVQCIGWSLMSMKVLLSLMMMMMMVMMKTNVDWTMDELMMLMADVQAQLQTKNLKLKPADNTGVEESKSTFHTKYYIIIIIIIIIKSQKKTELDAPR